MAEPTDLASDRTAPALSFFDIFPDDYDYLPHVARAIYVGTGGDIALVAREKDEAVIFKNVASGTILPVIAVAVRMAGTTATDLVGLQ